MSKMISNIKITNWGRIFTNLLWGADGLFISDDKFKQTHPFDRVILKNLKIVGSTLSLPRCVG